MIEDEKDAQETPNTEWIKTNHRVGAQTLSVKRHHLSSMYILHTYMHVCDMTQWIDLLNIWHGNHFYHIKLNVLQIESTSSFFTSLSRIRLISFSCKYAHVEHFQTLHSLTPSFTRLLARSFRSFIHTHQFRMHSVPNERTLCT